MTAREWAEVAGELDAMERRLQAIHGVLHGSGSRALCEAAKETQVMRLEAEAKAGREFVREVKQDQRAAERATAE